MLTKIRSMGMRRTSRRRGVQPASLVSAIAGSPMGLARRGSALIIVLGTLALMAVLAVIYVGVGNSDRRTSQAVVIHDRFDDVPDQIADYLSQVIADDVLSVYPQPGGMLRRETFDYPGTDREMLSVPQLSGISFGRWDEVRFNPTGSQPVRWTSNDPDFRDASDPWLASSEPSNLTPLDDITGAPQTDPGGFALITGLPSQAWYNNRDWRSISNFAPDGRGVNLYKLRGNLRAPSGITSGPQNGSGTRISDDLLLYDDNLVAQTPGSQQRWDNTAADPNRPADWFTFQRGLVRATNINYTNAPTWADPEYPHYQYADADGDGLFDSRWIELVDATNQTVRQPRSLLRQAGDFRYFIAVRAVDLSGRLNLNVASDFGRAPDFSNALDRGSVPDYLNPAGATPADLDLLRLLRGEDVYEQAPIGLRGIEPPRLVDGSVDVGSPQDYDLMDDQIARSVGDAAYHLLQFQRQSGVIPDRKIARTFSTTDPFESYVSSSFPDMLSSLQGLNGDGPIPNAPFDWFFSPDGRRVQFSTAAATQDGAALASMGGTPVHQIGNALGIPSLVELLTYEGINDPSTLSPLESLIGGRYDDGSFDQVTRSLDILRSNRQLAVEQRDRDGFDDIAGEVAPDGITDFDAMLHHQVDARHRLTTLSGARPIRSTVMLPGTADFLAPEEARFTPDDLAALDIGQTISTTELSELMAFYAGALLPERDPKPTPGEQPIDPEYAVWHKFLPSGGADPTGVWDAPGSPDFDRLRTLFYGYRGPELAIRTAAHMAVNMADMLDDVRDTNADDTLDTRDHRPSAMTVKLDDSYSDTDKLALVFDLSSTLNLRLASNRPSGPKAVNVYGIEPQPFITEVASFFIYHDVTSSKGGDAEWTGLINNCATPPTPGTPGTGAPITIDFTRDVVNQDYLLEMVAFQLTNPFMNDPLDPSAGPDLDLENYKIEFNGHTATIPAGEIILAGESRVFYWVRFTRLDTNQRFDDAGLIDGSDIIDTILDPSGTAVPPPLELVFNINDPLVGTIFEDAGGAMPLPGDPLRVYLWRPIDPNFALLPNTTMLADRLRIERFDDLFVANTQLGNLPVTNTCITAEFDPDDLGMTVFMHASVRRPEDERDALLASSVALPTYCMESRTRRDSNNDTIPETWNYRVFPDAAQRGPLNKSDFLNNNSYFFETFADADAWVPTLSSIFFQVGEPAWSKTYTRDVNGPLESDPSSYSRSGSDFGLKGSNDTFVEGLPRDKNDPLLIFAGNDELTDLRIELPTRLDARRLRAGDMLMPMAIGAWQELENPNFAMEEDQDHPGWVALSEAMAIALDYDTPRDANRAPLLDHPYFDAGRLTPESSAGSPTSSVGTPQREQYDADTLIEIVPIARGVLDKGHLVLDDFVPFYDNVTTPILGFVVERFDRDQDDRYGLGLPAALGIIENFSALASSQGSLTRPTPGVLNANTASQITLRTIPMLAPTANDDLTTGEREWWWLSDNGTNGPHGPNNDIASTLFAYRDMLPNFQPRESIVLINKVRLRMDDRPLATLISGIHETPGLRSVGEILAVRMKNPILFSNPTAPINARYRHNIDRLGFDGFGLQRSGSAPDDGTAGVDTVRYGPIPDPNSTTFPPLPGVDDGIIDDWDERLAIANAVFASTSVRTDFVAVWFLIHGYQDSDVAPLFQDGNDERPLVPTIVRRFVMVVDRSTVTRKGDRPRIVLLREVPR